MGTNQGNRRKRKKMEGWGGVLKLHYCPFWSAVTQARSQDISRGGAKFFFLNNAWFVFTVVYMVVFITLSMYTINWLTSVFELFKGYILVSETFQFTCTINTIHKKNKCLVLQLKEKIHYLKSMLLVPRPHHD